ncbi:signal peptidase I [Patulibacter sp. SYSU D01012]|uniref:signal peptidase I n=1 Tax=Patulibacter sp. SYSU D01012 TaxID=2817381 RepID=UPI001B310DE3|nr:signal peptidase I [Patulibacter sp. SYSU D01012]
MYYAAAVSAGPRPRRRVTPLRVAGWAASLVAVVLAAAMLLPPLLGFDRYVIVSGSMTGTYDTGSIVYTREKPVAALRVGDVITYAPPAGASPQDLVTHRIAAMTPGPGGQTVFRTKGDANAAADPWTFSLEAPRQAVVRFGVPYLGYAISALSVRQVRMVLLGVPAAGVALLLLVGLLRDARREAQEERTRRDEAPAAPSAGDEPAGDARPRRGLRSRLRAA